MFRLPCQTSSEKQVGYQGVSNVPACGISLFSETEGRELDFRPNTHKNREEKKMVRANEWSTFWENVSQVGPKVIEIYLGRMIKRGRRSRVRLANKSLSRPGEELSRHTNFSIFFTCSGVKLMQDGWNLINRWKNKYISWYAWAASNLELSSCHPDQSQEEQKSLITDCSHFDLAKPLMWVLQEKDR